MSTISNLYGSSWYSQNNDYNTSVHHKKEKDMISQLGFNETSSTSSTEDPLESLVSAGTITSEQEEEIKKAIDAAIKASAYSRFMIQSGTSDISENTETDPLASLVAAGTITEEQKTAIENALQSEIKTQNAPPPPPSKDDEDDFETTIESLVSAGTITEEQKDSIISALEAALEPNASQSSTTDDSSNYSGFNSMLSAFQSAVQAYEKQFEAGQEDALTNSLKVSFN